MIGSSGKYVLKRMVALKYPCVFKYDMEVRAKLQKELKEWEKEELLVNDKPDNVEIAIKRIMLAFEQENDVLDLHGLGLHSVPPLNLLKHLRVIKLNNNNIDKIKNKTFWDLEKVEELDLSGNKLKMVCEDMWRGLNRLKCLDVSHNQIEEIGTYAFMQVLNLEVLKMNHNRLSEIKTYRFNGLGRLKVLDLHVNVIERMEDDALCRLGELKELYLWGNGLTLIRKNTFSGLLELEVIDLAFNKIARIEDKAFFEAKNLRRIYLGHNCLQRIEERTLAKLKMLNKLYLQANEINFIALKAWKSCESLDELDLGENALEGINSEMFRGLKNLAILILKLNKIKMIDKDSFLNMDSTGQGTRLVVLDLSNNMLESVDGVLDGLGVLRYLNLSFNMLKGVHKKTFEGCSANMRRLNLSHNSRGMVLSGSIGSRNGSSFVLGESSLSSVRNGERERKSSESLAEGNLKVEEDTFHHFGKLEKLDLSGNFMQTAQLLGFQESTKLQSVTYC
jgi:Leucine-rich repeat (LRR) protein